MIDSYKTVGENTYEMIKKDIIFGNLKPLKKLKLNELKNNYKTSISTLREILSRLSGDGFVVYEEQFISKIVKLNFNALRTASAVHGQIALIIFRLEIVPFP